MKTDDFLPIRVVKSLVILGLLLALSLWLQDKFGHEISQWMGKSHTEERTESSRRASSVDKVASLSTARLVVLMVRVMDR